MIYLGTDYGGWHVEETLLDDKSVVFSAGLGDDISFDLELISRFGMYVHGFDPTPRSLEYLIKQLLPDHFILHAYGISNIDGDIMFTPPSNPSYMSYTEHGVKSDEQISLRVKRILSLMNEMSITKIDVLKMDIEGSEYGVIDDIFENNIFPIQVLVEFHACGDILSYMKKMQEKYVLKNVSNKDCCFILK